MHKKEFHNSSDVRNSLSVSVPELILFVVFLLCIPIIAFPVGQVFEQLIRAPLPSSKEAMYEGFTLILAGIIWGKFLLYPRLIQVMKGDTGMVEFLFCYCHLCACLFIPLAGVIMFVRS
jgi:hypothetical protein